MDSIMAQTGVDTGVDIIKQISLVNPVLGLLLLVLLVIVVTLYKKLSAKEEEIKTVQKTKEEEVKELNKVLLLVRESDKEMLIELKNLISRFIEVEKDHTAIAKSGSDKLDLQKDVLVQITTKLDYMINTLKP